MSEQTPAPETAPRQHQHQPAPARHPDPNYGLVARLGSKARGLKEENKVLAARAESQAADLKRLNEELATARKLADANAERKRADALAQQIREIKHKDAFRAAAKSAGADPDLVEDLYSLSGYKAEGDEADPGAMEGFIAGLKESRPKYFAAPAAEPAPAPPKPGPASGRGGKSQATGMLDMELMQDPVWMMDRDNQKLMAQAIKEKRVKYPDTGISRETPDRRP